MTKKAEQPTRAYVLMVNTRANETRINTTLHRVADRGRVRDNLDPSERGEMAGGY